MLLVSVAIIAGTVPILVVRDYGILHSLDFMLIALTILLMGSSAISHLLRYIDIASLKTKALVPREPIYSSAKIGLSIILILMGYGAIGSSFVLRPFTTSLVVLPTPIKS